MAGSVRVNLSVPEKVDGVLSGVAEMTGRSKAAVIMEAVGYHLPLWEQRLRSHKVQERAEGDQAVTSPDLAVGLPEAGKARGLSEQERWNRGVQQRKASGKKAKAVDA